MYYLPNARHGKNIGQGGFGTEFNEGFPPFKNGKFSSVFK